MKRAQFLYIALMITVAMVSLRAFAVARAPVRRAGPDGWQERTVAKPDAPAVNCVPAPSGLVSWWPFDGNGNDFQVTHNTALFNDPAFVPGEVDQALQFDGVDDFAAAPASLNVGTGNGFTIDLWINPTDVSTQRPLLEWNNGFSQGVHLWIAVPIEGGGPGSLFANIKEPSGANHLLSSGQGLLHVNTYHHVALMYDKGTNGVAAGALFIDGEVVAANFFSTFTPETSFDLFFGTRPASAERFVGQMDEVEIFNRALAASEIQAIYNAGSAGKCKTRFVTNANNSGAGSLRQAITDSNAYGATNTVAFNIPGGGVHTFNPTSALPNITGPVTIDGTTQPGYAGAPLIELNGTNAGSAYGLDCRASVTIKGLVINRFTGGGIQLGTEAGGSTVAGNYIGTDATGTLDLGNDGAGIFIQSNGNIIGGPAPEARNVISGNGSNGIWIVISSGNIVQGNYIGTDATGAQQIGNSFAGIETYEANSNQIGGMTQGTGNVISGNFAGGIHLSGGVNGSQQNLIQGNYIGTNAAGTAALGNGQEGIWIISGATNNTVGGTAPGAGNIIAFNNGVGVRVRAGSVRNAVRGNSIFSNGSLGIDLFGGTENAFGVTENDLGDGDTGPNNLQNFPVLTSAISSGDNTTIQGVLNSTPGQSFRIELFSNTACDPSGNGEGQAFIGFANLNTNAGGNGSFSVSVPDSSIVGPFITATATDVNGNTSEFSACFQVGCGCALSPTSRFFTSRGGAGSVDVITSAGCGWTASTPDNWISIVSSNTGTGSQRIDFEVRENFTGSPRQGAINIGGAALTVVQDAGMGQACGYAISPRSNTFSNAGGTGTVTVSSSNLCAWQATSNASWITITTGSAGIGNGAVSYSVASNPGPTGRNGAITIAGETFSIKQKAP